MIYMYKFKFMNHASGLLVINQNYLFTIIFLVYIDFADKNYWYIVWNTGAFAKLFLILDILNYNFWDQKLIKSDFSACNLVFGIPYFATCIHLKGLNILMSNNYHSYLIHSRKKNRPRHRLLYLPSHHHNLTLKIFFAS